MKYVHIKDVLESLSLSANEMCKVEQGFSI